MSVLPTIRAATAAAARLRVPHLIAGWAVLAVVTTPLARHATLGAAARGGADWVLTSGWMAVCTASLVVGVLVAQTTTVDALLVARGHSERRYLAARWVGATSVAVGASVVAGLTYVVSAVAWGLPLSWTVAQWTGLLAFEATVLVSLGCMLGRLARSSVALVAGLVLFIVGHLADETLALARATDAAAPWLYVVLPDLDRFNAHANVLTSTLLPTSTLVIAAVLATCWSAALLTSALWVTPGVGHSTQEPLT